MVSGSSDRVFDTATYLGIGFFSLIILYPLILIVSMSFSSPTAVVSGKVWLLPVNPTLTAYKAIFESRMIAIGYRNSLIYMTTGTIINLFLTILAAYPLSRPDLPGRGVIMGIFVFTLLFNGGLIPFYLVVRRLGMIDTLWAMIIPNGLSVYYMLIARTFFATTIPHELLEAARMEGASDFRFMRSCVLPLSGPIIAVLCLFYAVRHWNAYFHALIFMSSASKYPLQIVLKNILIDATQDVKGAIAFEEVVRREALRVLLRYALIVVASLPVLLIYPFVQRYFVRGALLGSIKG